MLYAPRARYTARVIGTVSPPAHKLRMKLASIIQLGDAHDCGLWCSPTRLMRSRGCRPSLPEVRFRHEKFWLQDLHVNLGSGSMSTVVLSPARVHDPKVTSDWIIVSTFLLVGSLLCAIFAIWSPAFAEALNLMS
jgi:hypothetical protein